MKDTQTTKKRASYVLRLVPGGHPNILITWRGYWAGGGYVANKKRAVRFSSRKTAAMIAASTFVGMNNCLEIVRV